jgi:fumarylacetoacetase
MSSSAASAPYYLPNETHDPRLTSWVDSANDPASDFPIQNLPFGAFATADGVHLCVAIGDAVLDLDLACHAGVLDALPPAVIAACCEPRLNALMAMDPATWSALRRELQRLLRSDAPASLRALVGDCLLPQAGLAMVLPAAIGDYTDFYASIYHATNVGRMFRPDNPLLPNYKYIPIGYHGRASSLVVSGTHVQRPCGQTRDNAEQPPVFGPSKRLDYELEIGCYIGPGNALGAAIPMADAERHMFGVCILNDWSARDVQTWEYQPLGPFLAKNFASSLSPWVVTIEALAPFRVPAFARPEGDPAPLPYLLDPGDQAHGGINLTVEVWLASQKMREAGMAAARLSRGNLRDLYWSLAQMVAHHASNGCNLRPGDLLGSGTVSGEGKDSRGCLLELTWRGTEPLTLPTGESRKFLEDGDELTIRAYAEHEGFRRIGCGECSGVIQPAR